MADFRGKSADDFDFTNLPPADAVEYFRRKSVGQAFSFDWRDVWQEEHARAFVVAKAMTVDILEDIHSAVDQAVADGIAFEDFRDNLEPILRAKGWWGRQLMTDPLTGEKREVQLGSVRRLQIIYDTNLRTSYSAGAWQQIQRTKALLPYLRYVDPDPNPRPQHLDWSGTVLRADDEWWDTHFTPNGWNCKCYVDSLGEKDLERNGYQLSAVGPTSGNYAYVNPRTGVVSEIARGIDPGFGHNPGKAGLAYAAELNLKEKLEAAIPAIAEAVNRIRAPERKSYLERIKEEWESAPEMTRRMRDRMIERPGAKRIIGRLGPRDFQAVVDYTSSPYKFNDKLREIGAVNEDVLALNRALRVLPEKPGTAWRGETRGFEEISKRFRPGSVKSFDSFYSSSSSSARARAFAGRSGTVFEIRGRSGRWIRPISLYPSEKEVLFAPGTSFRVKSVKRVGKRTYVVLEELFRPGI